MKISGLRRNSATEPLLDANGNPVQDKKTHHQKMGVYQPLTLFKSHWRSSGHEKIFLSLFILPFLFSGLVLACGTDAQREKMAEKLYADSDMQKFVCGSEGACSMQEFEDGLQFNSYEKPFHGKKITVCLIEPTLNARNSYTGIFSAKDGDFEFQFISYGPGVKVDANAAGIPMIVEYNFLIRIILIIR